jgi:hypothetical protein
VNPFVKGLIIAVIHACLISALGAKLLYDRATLPRVWVKTAPYDPNLPIRGRYVSLRVVVEPRGIKETKQGPESRWQPAQSVRLRIENERLFAEAKQKKTQHDSSGLQARYTKIGDESVVVLDEPVAFFIPENVPDPSRRSPGEQLWVETTIPKKGMPRPIRLGVKKDDGPIVPLAIK